MEIAVSLAAIAIGILYLVEIHFEAWLLLPIFLLAPWPLYRLIHPAGTADWAEQDADLYAASVTPLLTLYGFLPPDTSPQLLLARDCISLRLYDPALGAQLQSHSAHGTAPAGLEEIALELRRLTGTPCGEALCRCPGFELTLSGNGTGNLPVLLLRRAIPDGLSLECCAAALRRRYRGGRLKALSLQISRDL